MNEEVIYGLLVAGALSILGFVGLRIFHRTGVPDVLLLLLAGTLIGPVFGFVDVADLSSITPYFGTLALIFVLFDGGLELDFSLVLRQILPVLFLVVVSIATVFAGVSLLLIHVWAWHWLPAMLLATLLANTSGAIVLPVVSRLAIPEGDKTVLKLEAAVSDVLVIIMFVTLLSLLEAFATGGQATFAVRPTLGKLAGSFSIAIVIGTVAGVAWILVLNRISKQQHNYMATLGVMLALFSVSEYLGASGMMAVLFFGLVLANSRRFGQLFNVSEIHYTPNELQHLHGSFSFLVRTFFLIYIGLFLSAKIFDGDFLVPGLAVMGVLLLGRMITAGGYAMLFKRSTSARLATIAMLPRGLVVAALAMVPNQTVTQNLEARNAEFLAAETSLASAREAWNGVKAEMEETRETLDGTALQALIQKEVELQARVQNQTEAMERSRRAAESLEGLHKNTSIFHLFATLSILVTNILMTLGCFWVQKQTGQSVAPSRL